MSSPEERKKVKVTFHNFAIHIIWAHQATNRAGSELFCSAVLTPQHYHWYAATRFTFPGG